MDSMVGEDPTLPVNFEESANMAGLADVTTGPDITSVNFSEHFPDGNLPVIQKISSGRMSPIHAHTMKDYEQQISELKKENFSLKLRIYFMEERIEQNFDDDTKTNIELRVEVESLRKDLMEKQQLLVKASNAVESLAHEKDSLTDRLRRENHQALSHQREGLESALKHSRQECESVKRANEILQRRLSEAENQSPRVEPQVVAKDNNEAYEQELKEKKRQLEDLTVSLRLKDDMVAQLEAEKQYGIEDRIEPLQAEIQQLKAALDTRSTQLQELRADLDKERGDGKGKEDTIKEHERRLTDVQLASERFQQVIKDKDKAVKDLQNALQKAKQEHKDFEEVLASKDSELKSLQSNATKRDKAIQGLAEAVRAKDKEVNKLCDQADERDSALTLAREAMHKAQRSKFEGMEQYQATMVDVESKLADLRAGQHGKQLENERLQRSLARKQEEIDSLRHDGIEAEKHLNDLLEQRELTIKELKGQLMEAKLQTDEKVDAIEQHYQGLLEDSQVQLQNKDNIIQRLTKGLQDKDRLVQDDNGGNNALIKTLRERLKHRDKAVEEATEDKLKAVDAKEAEVRQLRTSLRDRDRDVDKAHADIVTYQDNVNQLQSDLKEMEAKIRQLTAGLEAQRQAAKDINESQRRSLAERDHLVQKLRQSLDNKDSLLDELQAARQREGGTVAKERDDVIDQLKSRLQDKDSMLAEVLKERSHATSTNDQATQDLLNTIRDKDNQIKELHERQNRLTANKNNVIKDLQKDLNRKDYSIQVAEDTMARGDRDQVLLLTKMRNAMADKDKTIEKLIESGREKDRLFREIQQSVGRQTPSPTAAAELANLRDKNESLKKTLFEREATLRQLQSDQPDSAFVDTLRHELDNKNKLLAKAKSTIDSLQQAETQSKQAMGQLRRQLIEFESELQAKQDRIDALIHGGKVKDNIIKELRLEQTNVPVRTAVMGGEGESSPQLQQILRDQMRELGRLSDALRAERQLYVNITQSGGGGEGRGSSPAGTAAGTAAAGSLAVELAAVQALRRQLEDGIRRNDVMRAHLEGQIGGGGQDAADMSPTAAKELQTLRNQLEDSSRWNASLQSRLDEMRQRVGGVGRDLDADQTADGEDPGRPSPTKKTVPELQREVLSLRTQLQEAERRRRSLQDVLDSQDVESLRSIPGQEEDKGVPSTTTTNAYQKRVQDLERRLEESERREQSAKQQLEAALLNQCRGEEEGGGPVVAILKQQLDQAKTLLRDKDHQLQQKEQQNQTLRHHLGIGPESPIHPGRSMLANLHQENARLQRDGRDVGEKNQALAMQLRSLQGQFDGLRRVNGALQLRLREAPTVAAVESPPAGDHLVPVLKDQLDQAKALLQEKDRQNQLLRDALRIGPDASPEDGRAFVEKLQRRNQQLKTKLKARAVGSEPDATADDASGARRADAETERLRKQLKNAQNLNELLKRHIDLNSSQDGADQPGFNPELIVDMAKEIERLQDRLREAPESPAKLDRDKNAVRVPSGDANALVALRQELARTQGELGDVRRRFHSLRVKLQATEGTVHHQADRIHRYRREMHNAGLAPPSTPKRVHSDSNLSGVSPRGLTVSLIAPPPDGSHSSSASTSDDASIGEFGKSDDPGELREQIGLLRDQVDRYKRIIRHLRRRLRNNSPSPNRAATPTPSETSSGGWFELTANQEAFERLKQEVENLRSQVRETNDANAALKTANDDLVGRFGGGAGVTATRSVSDGVLKSREDEIERLNGRLRESQGLCELLKVMTNDALCAVEEVVGKHGGKDAVAKETVAKETDGIGRAKYKMQKSWDLTDRLQRVLEEPMEKGKVEFVDVGSKPLYKDSLEAKDRDLARLKRELSDRKKLNRKLRDLVTDNQRVADETGQDLERLTRELQDKNEKIAELHGQLQLSIQEAASGKRAPPSGGSQPADDSCQQEASDVEEEVDFEEEEGDFADFVLASTRCRPASISASTQTEDGAPPVRPDPVQSRLRDTERLNSALKAELDVYRSVVGSGDLAVGTLRPDGDTNQQQETNNVLRDHLDELRQLRKKLEESIRVNDRLREQLEAQLAGLGLQREGTTIIRLEQTNIELSERNTSLEVLLSEKDRTIQDLREAASARGEQDRTIHELRGELERLGSLRLELTGRDRTIRELRGELQTVRSSAAAAGHGDKDRTIDGLRGDLKQARRDAQRYQAESQRLRDQIEENTHLAESLRFELSVYEHIHTKDGGHGSPQMGGASPRPAPPVIDRSSGLDLSELLREMRHLRVQLERSIDTNSALRLKLEEMMAKGDGVAVTTVTSERRAWASSMGNGVGAAAARDARRLSSRQLFNDGGQASRDVSCQTNLTGQTSLYPFPPDTIPDDEYYSIAGVKPLHNGHSADTGQPPDTDDSGSGEVHAICTVPTYDTLNGNVQKGRLAVMSLKNRLNCIATASQHSEDLRKIAISDVNQLREHLVECGHQVGLFWKSRIPDMDQVARLRRRLREQDGLMKEAIRRLSTTNRLKEDMELALIQQLSQTHEVLRQARGNLEAQSDTAPSSS